MSGDDTGGDCTDDQSGGHHSHSLDDGTQLGTGTCDDSSEREMEMAPIVGPPVSPDHENDKKMPVAASDPYM